MRRHRFHRFGKRRLDLSAFSPLVVAGDGHERGARAYGRAPHMLVVAGAHALFGGALVPVSNLGIIIAWAHTGDEEEMMSSGKAGHGGQIAHRAAVGEPV